MWTRDASSSRLYCLSYSICSSSPFSGCLSGCLPRSIRPPPRRRLHPASRRWESTLHGRLDRSVYPTRSGHHRKRAREAQPRTAHLESLLRLSAPAESLSASVICAKQPSDRQGTHMQVRPAQAQLHTRCPTIKYTTPSSPATTTIGPPHPAGARGTILADRHIPARAKFQD